MVYVVFRPIELFRCKVHGRTDLCAVGRLSQVRQCQQSRKTEIYNYRSPVGPDTNVLRFDIAVDDVFTFQCCEPVTQLREELGYSLRRPRLSQFISKVGSVDELLDNVVNLVIGFRGKSVFPHSHYVGMVQQLECMNFTVQSVPFIVRCNQL